MVDLPPLPGDAARRSGPCAVSFNPCCGGSASSARSHGLALVNRLHVSILVVVDLPPLRHGAHTWTLVCFRVSILVVVDLPPLLACEAAGERF